MNRYLRQFAPEIGSLGWGQTIAAREADEVEAILNGDDDAPKKPAPKSSGWQTAGRVANQVLDRFGPLIDRGLTAAGLPAAPKPKPSFLPEPQKPQTSPWVWAIGIGLGGVALITVTALLVRGGKK
jgi:hypothetical protein